MYPHLIITELVTHPHIAMIDGEFDVFELNNDLESNLREAETATFYHDALDVEE